MPNPTDILAGLTAIANDRIAIALLWHVVLLIAVWGIVLGWRPSHRTAALMLAALPMSVSALSFIYVNPFNGAAFALLSAFMLVSAIGRGTRVEEVDTPAGVWLGAALIAFGWIYPHFLISMPLLAYPIAAPTGLIPCPTLAVLIGFTLLRPRLFSRTWAITVACYGLFYSVFGVVRLGVWLDAGLFVGAVYLLATAWRGAHGVVRHAHA